MRLLGFLFLPLLCSATGFNAYIGDTNPYRTAAMVTDAAGNSYVTGGRVFGNLMDVFVTKVDASGNVVFTSTTGGKGSDTATSIAVDSSGNVWVGGYTTSPDFPLRDALQSQPCACANTGFLLKLAPDGTIVFASYFGGTVGASSVNGIAVDASGNAYVTGETLASDFPTTPGMPTGQVSTEIGTMSGAFISKISAAGTTVVFSGLISGDQGDCQGGSSCFLGAHSTSGAAIAVDSAGNAYMAGNTNTIDLATMPGAFAATGLGAFVAKVNASGLGLAYLTYLGTVQPNPAPYPASPYTVASAIAVDSSGNAYVTGATSDPNFPVTANAFQSIIGGQPTPNPPPFGTYPSDAFAAKFSPDGSALVWATYLGGTGADAARSLAVDASGNVWLAGTTQSPDFPNASGWSSGGDFLVELNSSGPALPFSARYPNNMVSTAVAVDGSGSVHAAGLDGLVSSFAPSAAPALEVYGISNAAIADLTGRIVPGEVISIYGPYIGPSSPVSYTSVNGFVPATLGGVQVTIGGYPAPLLYVSDWQIKAVVPLEIEGSTTSNVQVTFNGNQSPNFVATTSPAELGIFTNGNGYAIFNADGSANSPSNPASPGSAVSIWVTGFDLSGLALADGQIATAASFFVASPQWQVEVGSRPANILYAGSAPTLVNGIVQINFQVPQGGASVVTLVVGDRVSPQVILYVTN